MNARTQHDRLRPTSELFRRAGDIPSTAVSPERAAGDGIACRLLMVTEDMQCSEISWRKGEREKPRSNGDHSTIGCLVSGKLKLTIGDETFVASPGDAWMVPQGVVHQAEALEDASGLEVKAPAYPS